MQKCASHSLPELWAEEEEDVAVPVDFNVLRLSLLPLGLTPYVSTLYL